MDKNKLGSPLLDPDERIEELEQILAGVMQYVDTWVKGEEFDLTEVERAKIMYDRVFELVDKKDQKIMNLKHRLNMLAGAKIAYICDHKACEDCSGSDCLHTTNITHAMNFEKLPDDDKYMEKLPFQKIYLITVFEKCEPGERSGYNLGHTRSVGWRPSFEMAENTVKTNRCDVWEHCYDYACIEELDYGLYPFAEERWFYKFNRETGQYDEIDEPAILKYRGPIGGIG